MVTGVKREDPSRKSSLFWVCWTLPVILWMWQSNAPSWMVPPCVLIFGVLAVGVLVLISGCNIATQIYTKAFASHRLRFYNTLFLVIFAFFSKEKKPQLSKYPGVSKGSVLSAIGSSGSRAQWFSVSQWYQSAGCWALQRRLGACTCRWEPARSLEEFRHRNCTASSRGWWLLKWVGVSWQLLQVSTRHLHASFVNLPLRHLWWIVPSSVLVSCLFCHPCRHCPLWFVCKVTYCRSFFEELSLSSKSLYLPLVLDKKHQPFMLLILRELKIAGTHQW